MSNVEDSLRRDEGALRGVKGDSVRPVVIGLIFVAVPLLTMVIVAIHRPQPKTPETYTGPFRLGMTYDEAKKHLPADSYLSKAFYGEPPPGEPVWYTLTQEVDGGYGTLFLALTRR